MTCSRANFTSTFCLALFLNLCSEATGILKSRLELGDPVFVAGSNDVAI
jgi:hypothetical protein